MSDHAPLPLKDLAPSDQLALAALLRLLVRLDGHFTAGEQEELGDLALSMGERRFWQVMDQAAQTLPDEANIREAARGVTDQAARELLYVALVRVAESDVIQASEAGLLEWLRTEWGIVETPA